MNLTQKQKNKLNTIHKKMIYVFCANPERLAKEAFIFKTQYGIPPCIFFKLKCKLKTDIYISIRRKKRNKRRTGNRYIV